MNLIQYKKYNLKKYKTKEYNTHLQRLVELSLRELLMMEKVPKQTIVEIRPIPFQNDDTINAHLENQGNILVELQPKYALQYVVYPFKESN